MTQPWMKGERVVESCRRRFFRKMADDQRGHAGPTDAVTQQELDETDENADNCTCLTCMQNVNDDEKDLLPESREKVKWIRSNLSRKTGHRTPAPVLRLLLESHFSTFERICLLLSLSNDAL